MEEKTISMIEPVDNEEKAKTISEGVLYRKCKDCGSLFPMTESKVKSFLDKYGTVPKRCYACRQKRLSDAEQNK